MQFYFAALTGKKDFTCSYDVLQLPFGDAKESYGINLGTDQQSSTSPMPTILPSSTGPSMSEKDMAYLASVGADALITDYPDRAANVLNRQ